MSEVRRTWCKLIPHLKFDAVIRSKLLHGLETLHLTQSLAKKLDVFFGAWGEFGVDKPHSMT